jgi:hypothetical protein
MNEKAFLTWQHTKGKEEKLLNEGNLIKARKKVSPHSISPSGCGTSHKSRAELKSS